MRFYWGCYFFHSPVNLVMAVSCIGTTFLGRFCPGTATNLSYTCKHIRNLSNCASACSGVNFLHTSRHRNGAVISQARNSSTRYWTVFCSVSFVANRRLAIIHFFGPSQLAKMRLWLETSGRVSWSWLLPIAIPWGRAKFTSISHVSTWQIDHPLALFFKRRKCSHWMRLRVLGRHRLCRAPAYTQRENWLPSSWLSLRNNHVFTRGCQAKSKDEIGEMHWYQSRRQGVKLMDLSSGLRQKGVSVKRVP